MATTFTSASWASFMISFRISKSLSDPLFLDFMLVVNPPILTPVLVRERSKPMILTIFFRLLQFFALISICG